MGLGEGAEGAGVKVGWGGGRQPRAGRAMVSSGDKVVGGMAALIWDRIIFFGFSLVLCLWFISWSVII